MDLNEWGGSLIRRVQTESNALAAERLEFSIFYSPLRLNPKLLIVGDNPGGPMEQRGLYKIPDRHEYLFIDPKDDYKMAKMMREKIMAGQILEPILRESVKTNRIFFRTRNLREFGALQNQKAMVLYCKNILREIILTIRPLNILAESLGTFRSLSATELPILVKSESGKCLLVRGEYEGIPVYGINHPSRASYHRINDNDWADVSRALEDLFR